MSDLAEVLQADEGRRGDTFASEAGAEGLRFQKGTMICDGKIRRGVGDRIRTACVFRCEWQVE
jgi:hypothetical protein